MTPPTPRRPGKPPATDDRGPSRRLTIRLTPDAHARLLDRAAAMDLPPTTAATTGLLAWLAGKPAAEERARIVAWLRRPVSEEEARSYLARRGRHDLPDLEQRFNGGDCCWTVRGAGIVCYDRDIRGGAFAAADAIERGEHLEVTR